MKHLYQVTTVRRMSSTMSVEAEDIDEACQIAEDEGSRSLCYHCSEKFEVDDIDGFIVAENDEEIEDSTAFANLRASYDVVFGAYNQLVNGLKEFILDPQIPSEIVNQIKELIPEDER